MTGANSGEEAIAKAMHRIMNAERVEGYIKKPLEEVIHYEGRKAFLSASDDMLMLLIFTYIDLMGYLYKGSSKSIYAVEFIREYLGKVDRRYSEVGGLLYDAIRHGMVHLSTPKRMKLQDGKILDFLFSRSGQREEYLKIVKYPEMQRTGARVDIYRLTLDLPLLYKDLISAINKYIEGVRREQVLSDVFEEAFGARRKPERATEEQLINKPYIRQSDFDFVKRLISNL